MADNSQELQLEEQPSTSSAFMDSHLSYPAPTFESQEPPPSTSSHPRQLLKERLYVGNLHPTVDEYTLLKVFSKFGKIAKLDFLFHKSGPMKGKPRGYAFVEYSSKEDAEKALVGASDKLLRGRKLVITYAHQTAPDQAQGTLGRQRRGMTEVGKPTTLSMLKSASSGRSHGTDDKIARMEAKLRQLEQSPREPSISSAHPSLPPKPTPAPPGFAAPATRPHSTGKGKAVPRTLPSLPLASTSTAVSRTKSGTIPTTVSSVSPPSSASQRKGQLQGVRIMKQKDR